MGQVAEKLVELLTGESNSERRAAAILTTPEAPVLALYQSSSLYT